MILLPFSTEDQAAPNEIDREAAATSWGLSFPCQGLLTANFGVSNRKSPATNARTGVISTSSQGLPQGSKLAFAFGPVASQLGVKGKASALSTAARTKQGRRCLSAIK